MKLEGEYIFDGPREEVWKIVRDPEVLMTALPGAQELEQVGENEYAGKMNIRIGPVSGVFSGKLVVSDEAPPESYTLSVEGRGAPGFGKGVGHVVLLEHEDGKTLMKYDGDMEVGGRLDRLLTSTPSSNYAYITYITIITILLIYGSTTYLTRAITFTLVFAMHSLKMVEWGEGFWKFQAIKIKSAVSCLQMIPRS